MQENQNWEKRKLYNGYECYILERMIENSSLNTNGIESNTETNLNLTRKNIPRIKFIDNYTDRHRPKSKCDIILAQNGEMLGYVQMVITEDKKAIMHARDNYLLYNLPLEFEQHRDMISQSGAAIFVNPEYRRQGTW